MNGQKDECTKAGDVIGRDGVRCLETGLSMMYYEFCAYPMKLVS